MTHSFTFSFDHRSVFVDNKDIPIIVTFANVSADFIQGLMFVDHIIVDDEQIPGEISTDVKFDSTHFTYVPNDNDDNYISQFDIKWENKQNVCKKFVKLCNKYNVNITKRYSTIIYRDSDQIIITQSESPDFIAGVETYLSWIKSESVSILTLGVFDNMRSCHVNVKPQLTTVDKKVEVKQLINEPLISDLFSTIWGYVPTKCWNDEGEIFNCVGEIDITNDSALCIRCDHNKVGVKPFLCKVELV